MMAKHLTLELIAQVRKLEKSQVNKSVPTYTSCTLYPRSVYDTKYNVHGKYRAKEVSVRYNV